MTERECRERTWWLHELDISAELRAQVEEAWALQQNAGCAAPTDDAPLEATEDPSVGPGGAAV